MAIEDDDKPRKKITHEIGQDLSLLSVEELTERIALMNSEIERLQVAMTKSARRRMRRTAFSSRKGHERDLSPRRPCERRDPYAAALLVARPLADSLSSSPPVVMGPCVRRDDSAVGVNIKLGHWPTWQIIPEENRSFTKD